MNVPDGSLVIVRGPETSERENLARGISLSRRGPTIIWRGDWGCDDDEMASIERTQRESSKRCAVVVVMSGPIPEQLERKALFVLETMHDQHTVVRRPFVGDGL